MTPEKTGIYRAASARRPARAFTMMEVTIVSMISVVAFSVIYMFWNRTQESFIQGNFKYLVQHEGQKLIENVKRDLLQSCKIVRNEADISVPLINRVGETWTFLKFNSEFKDGRPLPEEVTYEFKKAEGKIVRSIRRGSLSKLAKTENQQIAQKVTDFQINPYTLNGLKYFQIRIKMGVTAAETHIRGEEFTLITSVESRFDNNYLRQRGWIDNKQTRIYNINSSDGN